MCGSSPTEISVMHMWCNYNRPWWYHHFLIMLLMAWGDLLSFFNTQGTVDAAAKVWNFNFMLNLKGLCIHSYFQKKKPYVSGFSNIWSKMSGFAEPLQLVFLFLQLCFDCIDLKCVHKTWFSFYQQVKQADRFFWVGLVWVGFFQLLLYLFFDWFHWNPFTWCTVNKLDLKILLQPKSS